MGVRATRLSGGIIASVGTLLLAFFLLDAATTTVPAYWLFQSYPIVVSIALAGVGISIARGNLIAEEFIWRLLGWMVVGIVVLSLFLAWFFGVAVILNGRTPLDPPIGIVTLPALGALVGLLVGTYDARAVARRRETTQLSKINETLRIATGELVEKTDRDALERAVCERLVESDSFAAAWIGRYDPEDGFVRPVTWAGFDDVVESFAVPVDTGEHRESVWTRVLENAEGQVVQNVLGDESFGRWRDAFEERRIASAAVVPIVDADHVYGVVCLCADQPNAFDEHQRQVLGELGETVGHAIDSIRAHDALEARKRELREQNDRLDEFAGVLTHDLRNPLNVIMGRLALMQEVEENEHLDAIEQSGHRMHEIITDLRALSRASRADVRLEPVSLRSVAAESWRSTESAGAEFDLEIPDETTILADPARLRTVFENLFRNASEHNDPPVTVRVGLIEPATTDTEASHVGFYVEDDGDGVPADDREAIFDHGYTTNADGTGFGLSIVRGIVDAHDWEISIREGRDDGARFEVTGVELDDRSAPG